MNKAFFLDRDGTIIVDKHYLSNPNEVELLVGAAKAIRLMNEAGYKVIVVSNQSGVARGMFTMKDVDKVNQRLNQLLDMENAHIDAFYICPHHPNGIISPYNIQCKCRKPETYLFEKATKDYQIDLTVSAAIGDRKRDVEKLTKLGIENIGIIKAGTEIYGYDTYDSLLSFTKKVINNNYMK